ncbi:MAG TPA: hypothetical protein VFT98_05800 [Myxococcota bacterium]|nr:hypothetical protein [Myxococcota bacterium]
MLLVLGAVLFRLLRPLRDRIEAWLARMSGASERDRVIELRRRRNGAFGAEDSDGD